MEIVASLSEAKTAKEPGRTQFARMLEIIESGGAEGILAWHPDRLARNSVDGGKIIHLLDTGKLKSLKFPTFWFEPTPQGKFMLNIAFGQSKYYVDNLSENVKRGMREKVRRGEWTWPAPLGYINNREKRNIEPDPEKASLIRKAFELYATGEHTFLSLRNELTRIGLYTRKGKVLPISNVQKMLQHHVYYGVISMNGELFHGAFEPIVSKKLFDKVQETMQRKNKPKRRRKHEFPFTGFLHCFCCGCAISAEIQKGHHYYKCTHKRGPCDQRKYLREEGLLGQVRKIVEQVSMPDDWAENMLQEIDKEEISEKSDHQGSVQQLEDERKQIDKQLDDLLDMRLESAISTEEYLAKKNKLVSRKVEIDQEIKDVEHHNSNWLEPMRDMVIRSKEAKKLLSTSDHGEFPTFLKTIGTNFVLKGNTVQWEAEIGWHVLAKSRGFRGWWAGRDSNPRSRRHLVYSQTRLTTSVPTHLSKSIQLLTVYYNYSLLFRSPPLIPPQLQSTLLSQNFFG